MDLNSNSECLPSARIELSYKDAESMYAQMISPGPSSSTGRTATILDASMTWFRSVASKIVPSSVGSSTMQDDRKIIRQRKCPWMIL